MVESEREIKGQITRETCFYIGVIVTDVKSFAQAVRGHWGVQNQLHWRLDVSFDEDDSRVRDPAARENLALIRRIILTRPQYGGSPLST